MIQKEQITVQCPDGVVLRGTLLLPPVTDIKAVVQFNGGTAVKKEFYLAFLDFLAQNGFVCLLWDYRGSGDSRPDDMSQCTYYYRDYGMKDMPTVKKYLTDRFPEHPFLMVGHSTGGQQIGFIENLQGIRGLLCFAVSTGYMRYMPLSYRLKSYFFFYVFAPLSIARYGYLRAKKFGFMEDLPRNVVREWRDWCECRNYLFDPRFYGKSVPVGNFEHYDFPIHVFWTPDDPISNEKSVPDFWKNIKNKHTISFQKILPRDYGAEKIEHLGFFKKQHENKLWQEALEKLNAFLV